MDIGSWLDVLRGLAGRLAHIRRKAFHFSDLRAQIMKNIGKPCASEPHARFDEGGQARACSLLYPFVFTSLTFTGEWVTVCLTAEDQKTAFRCGPATVRLPRQREGLTSKTIRIVGVPGLKTASRRRRMVCRPLKWMEPVAIGIQRWNDTESAMSFFRRIVRALFLLGVFLPVTGWVSLAKAVVVDGSVTGVVGQI